MKIKLVKVKVLVKYYKLTLLVKISSIILRIMGVFLKA